MSAKMMIDNDAPRGGPCGGDDDDDVGALDGIAAELARKTGARLSVVDGSDSDSDGDDGAGGGGGGGGTLAAYVRQVFAAVGTPPDTTKISASTASAKAWQAGMWQRYAETRVAVLCTPDVYNPLMRADGGAIERMLAAPTHFDYSTLRALNVNDTAYTCPLLMTCAVEAAAREVYDMYLEAAHDSERKRDDAPTAAAAGGGEGGSKKYSVRGKSGKLAPPTDFDKIMWAPLLRIMQKQAAVGDELAKKQPADCATAPRLVGVDVAPADETADLIKAHQLPAVCCITGVKIGTEIMQSAADGVLKIDAAQMCVVKLTHVYTPAPAAPAPAAPTSSSSDDDSDSAADMDSDDGAAGAGAARKKSATSLRAAAAAAAVPTVHETRVVVVKTVAVYWHALHVLSSPGAYVIAKFRAWLHDPDLLDQPGALGQSFSDLPSLFVMSLHMIKTVDEFKALTPTLAALQYTPDYAAAVFDRVYCKLMTVATLAAAAAAPAARK